MSSRGLPVETRPVRWLWQARHPTLLVASCMPSSRRFEDTCLALCRRSIGNRSAKRILCQACVSVSVSRCVTRRLSVSLKVPECGSDCAGEASSWGFTHGSTTHDIFEGTEQIQQLVISRTISGLRIE